MRCAPLLGAAALSAACVVPKGSIPSTQFRVDTSNKYVHRGMVQNERGVVQPSAIVALPTEKDGTIIVRGWANMDLSNDTGDAWLPDGHAGKFSQIDFNVLYEQQLDEATITSGIVSYNLPNGLEFPFGERGATTEFVVEGRYDLGDRAYDIVPTLSLHYDFDEVNGLYVKAGAERFFAIDEDWSVTGEIGLGWMDGDQANWNYAEPGNSGLADLTLRATGEYAIDAHTTATGFLAFSTIVDSEYRDWFDLLGIDSNQLWLGIGIDWSY